MQLATWGTYRFKADAQKCADEIMEICDELESATPQQILDKARDSNTELHKCFTWDDTEAAEKIFTATGGVIVPTTFEIETIIPK